MKKLLNKYRTLIEEIILFIIGGFIYFNFEIFARGFSHWSMFIVGGLCFVIIGLLNEIYSWNLLFQWQCLIGSGTITILEFFSGCIVNKLLNWNVWDYSDMSFNLLGQVCLHHTILYWIPLSAIAIIADDLIRYYLFKEEKPYYSFKRNYRRL